MTKLSEILEDLSMVVAMRERFEQTKNFKEFGRYIEVNGNEIRTDEKVNLNEVEFIRIDHFRNLDYIYFWNFGTDKELLMFDVYEDEFERSVIDSATINTLMEHYAKYMEFYKNNKGE